MTKKITYIGLIVMIMFMNIGGCGMNDKVIVKAKESGYDVIK